MLTIAGSGPSSAEYGHVTVATKKRPCRSDYIMVRFPFQDRRVKQTDVELMSYYQRGEKGGDWPAWYADSVRWDKYWSGFIREQVPPQRVKPSLGTCAVMAVVERWQVNEIGLIGFDNILDGNSKWEHDAIAERACIESLVKIVDLRQGS